MLLIGLGPFLFLLLMQLFRPKHVEYRGFSARWQPRGDERQDIGIGYFDAPIRLQFVGMAGRIHRNTPQPALGMPMV